MTSRRSFGSVRRLPSGRWQATYWRAGKLVSAGTFPTKADARAALADAEVAMRAGTWVDPGAGKVTLGAYAGRWVDDRSDLRPTTRAKYQGLLARHVLPALGDRPLAALTAAAVRGWYHSLAGTRQTTADDAYRLLRAVLNTAVADQLIGRNPCQVRGAGQVRSAERPVATVAQVQAGADAMPAHLRMAVLLACWCQLRRGEVLGLQRGDIAPDGLELKVERAWTSAGLGPPKTDAGSRTLTVPANIRPDLLDHLERHAAPGPTGWLFPGRSGRPLPPLYLSRSWRKARTVAGRPDLTVHDLRHSGLTLAAATGASVAELMRRGGHSNPQAALRYQHATDDRDRVLADALAGLASVISLRLVK